MRVSPPDSLRLDREALLRDVRQRLAERIPAYGDAEVRPTDPGWLMMEEAAWMVELLSEQLDRYPLAVLRQFLHLLGAEPRPATPAIGALVARVNHPGVLSQPADRPGTTRFFTAQTETRDMLEFVPLENNVPLRPARIQGVARQSAGEIWATAEIEEGDLEGQIARITSARKIKVFAGERIRYRLRTTNLEEMGEALAQAVEALNARRVGWLDLEIAPAEGNDLILLAKVDPDGAFRHTVPDGFAPGGDVVADWGVLDDLDWRPEVTLTSDDRLSPQHHGGRPLRGPRNHTLLVPDVAPQSEVSGLLELPARPLTREVVLAIWRTLANLDTRLARLRVQIERYLSPEVTEDPDAGWIEPVLALGDWDALVGVAPATIVVVTFPEDARKAGPLRICTSRPAWTPGATEVRAIGLGGSARLREAGRKVREVWTLDLPTDKGERGMARNTTYEVELLDKDAALLLVLDEAPDQVFLNPLLVINAPPVYDGRIVTVERSVPEAIDLVDSDMVTPGVIDQLLDSPLSPAIREALRSLPLARMLAQGREPLSDYAGVQVDPTAGRIVVNAPDRNGVTRRIPSEGTLEVLWLRRTDGAAANVEANAIEFVEQPPDTRPALFAVRNPAPTLLGAARETDEACMERLFGPQDGLPVLPGDWERTLRSRLGTRGLSWMVRCWGHAERSLLSTLLWPLERPFSGGNEEQDRLRAALAKAGPETLLVAVGSAEGLVSDADLEWARQVVEATVGRVAQRIPHIRKAIVTRLWPLDLEPAGPPPTVFPCFDSTVLAGGTLVDPQQRRSPAPPHGLLLNAAVVRIRPRQGDLR